MHWGYMHQLYQEIQRGLYGSNDEKDAFTAKWLSKGLQEAAENERWDMFEDVIEYEEGTNRTVRDPRTILEPHLDVEKLLGWKKYKY
jgi:hypothetical protein